MAWCEAFSRITGGWVGAPVGSALYAALERHAALRPQTKANHQTLMCTGATGVRRAPKIDRRQGAFDTSLHGEVKGQADPEAGPITLVGVFARSKRHALSGAVSGRFLM
jgi:hypothetical protein